MPHNLPMTWHTPSKGKYQTTKRINFIALIIIQQRSSDGFQRFDFKSSVA